MTSAITMPARKTTTAVRLPHVYREGFYLTSQGSPLFAWLHSTTKSPRGGHGVLLCPPIGHEQIHAHRALRHLADALARAGFVVCRIDYHGSCDSAGSDEDSDRVPTWNANVRDALEWMRSHLECPLASVIGLRFGAALALQAAATLPVANLVLWSPILRGRAYVRELQALSMLGEAGGGDSESPDLEAGGFVISKQTADAISTIDLRETTPQTPRLLFAARNDVSSDRTFCDRLLSLGIEAEQIGLPGYAEMMAEPHETAVPTQAIESIVQWLKSGPMPATDVEEGHEPVGPTEIVLPDGGVRDRLICVRRSPDLWGILSEPSVPAKPHLPLVLLLNAGATHRVGPNRWYVMLARALAAQGFRCLRLDLSGLGDSEATNLGRENDPYGESAFGDVERALEFVQEELGAQRIVVAGLCSGAYFAFQSAVQMRHPKFVESVLINPLTFFWQDGMKVQTPSLEELRATHYYFRSALQPRKWLKLLTGKSQIGLWGALKLALKRLSPVRSSAPSDSGEAASPHHIGHPQREDLSADLARAAETGRNLTCFFSSSDPGHLLLMKYAGRKAKSLQKAGMLRIVFLENSDHTFSRRAMRVNAIQAIVKHLSDRYA